MWKSNPNPFSKSQTAEWRSYSDVETAIIEEAFLKKEPRAIIDDYYIDFQHELQISNKDGFNQRPIKRITDNYREAKLRETRFLPNPLSPSAPFAEHGERHFIYAVDSMEGMNGICLDVAHKIDVRHKVIERAAAGLIIEGNNVGKGKEGEWMAKQLLSVKDGTKEEVWQCCARLYSMESFLYKRLNEEMRSVGDSEEDNLRERAQVLGPFALLLFELRGDPDGWTGTVYRGANLSDKSIKIFKNECDTSRTREILNGLMFHAFTSTSRNRSKAEEFGNVLFIIDINEFDGRDVSPYSDYPAEEEQLLEPSFEFTVKSCDFDETKKKWIIHLVSTRC